MQLVLTVSFILHQHFQSKDLYCSLQALNHTAAHLSPNPPSTITSIILPHLNAVADRLCTLVVTEALCITLILKIQNISRLVIHSHPLTFQDCVKQSS